MQSSYASTRTPPRRCGGGAVSEATPVGESRDRRCRSGNPTPNRPRRSCTGAQNTLSVNETFEGLASPSTLSAVSTRMVIPIRSMRHEIEQWSAQSDSPTSQSHSMDVPTHMGGPGTGACPRKPRAPSAIYGYLLAGPVAEGAVEGGDLSSSIGWDAQVSDMIDQQLDMFAPAAAALGMMPSIANEPGMYKAAPSAFDIGSDADGGKGGAASDGDEQMNTRWSFEADVQEPDEAEVARVFGEAEDKPVRPPLPPVRTSSRASSSKPSAGVRIRKVPKTLDERRQLFDAAMQAGAHKCGGAYAHQVPPTACHACARLGRKTCPDCQLRDANRRLMRDKARQVKPGPADAAKRRSGKPQTSVMLTAPTKPAGPPVSGESDVHVLIHLHGVSDMPVAGGARLFAVHKDISSAGAALLFAVTGKDADIYHLQRALEMKRPVSRDLSWTMMSADARDFIEGLLNEGMDLDAAFQVLLPVACWPSA